MNSFANALNMENAFTYTENGSLVRTSTNFKVYDMFGVGAAYRKRSDEDCILLFKEAFEESPILAMKCLFYLRDCRGGQGERRFFRVVFKWLAQNHPQVARKNIELLPEYGRYDDLFILFGTPLESDMIKFVHQQLQLDLSCEKSVSLLAKWMPSENASSPETILLARTFTKAFGWTSKMYRKNLVKLRNKINIVETLMSQNRWDEIEFDKVPSKAGLIYRNAFARRDIIAKKYETFIKSEDTKVNARALYPYEIVAGAAKGHYGWNYDFEKIDDVERAALEKYWNNLPDYCEGSDASLMCVVDTSGSMTGREAAAPINVAIALGMYCAERLNGPFHNHFISFSSRPQYIEIRGIDFVDKVQRIYRQNLCENTNLQATFDLLLKTALREDVQKEDVPNTIVIISDMEIDYGTTERGMDSKKVRTMMEGMRKKWEKHGLTMPKLVYWNVQSRNQNKFLDNGPDVTYVSGASPTTFEAVLKGKTGIDMMLDILNKDRYNAIQA